MQMNRARAARFIVAKQLFIVLNAFLIRLQFLVCDIPIQSPNRELCLAPFIVEYHHCLGVSKGAVHSFLCRSHQCLHGFLANLILEYIVLQRISVSNNTL